MNDNTKNRALRLLERRDFSERELLTRLLEKGETQADAAEVVARLAELGFVNDERYAGLLVRRCAEKGYGPRRVRDELYRRGIPKALWEDALERLPVQTETLDALLARRLRGRDSSDRAELKRAAAALARRGFTQEEIRAALERYLYDEAE